VTRDDVLLLAAAFLLAVTCPALLTWLLAELIF